MAVTIAIAPAGVVGVMLLWRDDLVEQALEVAQRAGFVFDGGQPAGGGGAKDGDDAVAQARFDQAALHSVGDVEHVGVAAGGELQGEGFDGHRSLLETITAV